MVHWRVVWALGFLCGPITEAAAKPSDAEPEVVLNKRFGGAERHQLSLLASTSIATKFVEALGPQLAYQWNLGDRLGFELNAAYFASGETSIMQDVRSSLGVDEPSFSDLHQMVWSTGAGLVFVPIYGKLSFIGELDSSYDVFLLGGAGVAGTRRQRGNDPAVRTFDRKVSFMFYLGGGVRLYLSDRFALRIELREYAYPEPSPDVSGLTWNLHLQGGVQYTFGSGS